MKILIFGLPGSGKTTLARELKRVLEEADKSVLWLNADAIRNLYDDWDFSHEGRLRQAIRMVSYARVSEDDYVIADFIAPTDQIRKLFDADFSIWMDTIEEGRFEDTNKVFQKPKKADVIIKTFEYSVQDIINKI